MKHCLYLHHCPKCCLMSEPVLSTSNLKADTSLVMTGKPNLAHCSSDDLTKQRPSVASNTAISLRSFTDSSAPSQACQVWHVLDDSEHLFELLCHVHGDGLCTVRCQDPLLWHAQLLSGRFSSINTTAELDQPTCCCSRDSSEVSHKGHAN